MITRKQANEIVERRKVLQLDIPLYEIIHYGVQFILWEVGKMKLTPADLGVPGTKELVAQLSGVAYQEKEIVWKKVKDANPSFREVAHVRFDIKVFTTLDDHYEWQDYIGGRWSIES